MCQAFYMKEVSLLLLLLTPKGHTDTFKKSNKPTALCMKYNGRTATALRIFPQNNPPSKY